MKVKAYLILTNWLLSLMGLCISDESPLWAIALMVVWFALSSFLLKLAYKRGWLDDFYERFNIN